MTDIKNALSKIEDAIQDLMHLESAAISPQTNHFIENGREAQYLIKAIREERDLAFIDTGDNIDKNLAKLLKTICGGEDD